MGIFRWIKANRFQMISDFIKCYDLQAYVRPYDFTYFWYKKEKNVQKFLHCVFHHNLISNYPLQDFTKKKKHRKAQFYLDLNKTQLVFLCLARSSFQVSQKLLNFWWRKADRWSILSVGKWVRLTTYWIQGFSTHILLLQLRDFLLSNSPVNHTRKSL